MLKTQLRKQIRRSVHDEQTKFLDDIGTAQLMQELNKMFLEIAKQTRDQMVEESSIRSSMSYEDMKQYLEEVITEIRKHDNNEK